MVWGYGYRIFCENRPCNQQARINSESTLTAAVGRVIRFAGHAGIQVLELASGARSLALGESATGSQPHRRVHAAAMALLAESATGYIVGLSLPAGKTPVINR